LMEAIKYDEEPELRSLSAKALGEIGPSAAVAIPLLKEALLDEHEWVRDAANKSLLCLGIE
jgi:HEAT repeat protein